MKYSAIVGLALGLSIVFSKNIFAQCSVHFDRCPNDTTIVDCDKSGDEIMHFPPVIANPTALCSGFQLIQTTGPITGSLTPLGSYAMQFEARGLNANQQVVATAGCAFTVHIVPDLQPPAFLNCPPNITVYGLNDGTGHCSTTAFWTPPTSTDPCGKTTVSVSGGPCGSVFQNGTSTVVYTSVDASGNSSNCSFNVTVICISESTEPGKRFYDFRIFPNPNPGFFTVELPHPATPGMSFRVTDLAGRLVLQKQTEAGNERQTVQAGDLPDGLYFLQVMQDGRVLAVEKFVKQH